MAQNFLVCDREQELLLPPSLREWLPEGHLAWFMVDAVAVQSVRWLVRSWTRPHRARKREAARWLNSRAQGALCASGTAGPDRRPSAAVGSEEPWRLGECGHPAAERDGGSCGAWLTDRRE
jgi:hypothetical protein